MPAPVGLVRHGVAPDHPRIKQVMHARHRVLDQPGLRLFGNVDYGRDITLADLRASAFDHNAGVLPHDAGRVLALDGQQVPGVYAVGWIKRGAVGLIGHTKGCALETVGSLLADADGLPDALDRPAPGGHRGAAGRPGSGVHHLGRLAEAGQGRAPARRGAGRDRLKVVPREEMVELSRSE